MNEQPIRKKHTHYPKDFLPASHQTNLQKFTFTPNYQIAATSLQKYHNSIEQPHQSHTQLPNPEKSIFSQTQLHQDNPLGHHLTSQKPDLDAELLKRPRFSLNDKQEIAERDDIGFAQSPGCIRKQLAGKQSPLPAEDPCKIELVKSNSSVNKKIEGNYIKYRSTGDFNRTRWLSSEKGIKDQFNESRCQFKEIRSQFKESRCRVQELPQVRRKSQQQEGSFAAAREQYEAFRRRQESTGTFGKMNSLLKSMKNKDDNHNSRLNQSELPSFDVSAVERIKQDVNNIVRNKKGIQNQSSSQEQHENQQPPLTQQKTHFSSREIRNNLPELLVSYRSPLSYLKDLYEKSLRLTAYHLVVKIPKLFVEELIFRGQSKQELYETARSIFYQLKIAHENLVIKKYTNCTMLIARNVCMIWHFDGRRYLGGWQSDYLDEGFKHGLGLEWEPRKYVYYGEYVKNKRHGLGLYKDKDGLNCIGYWQKGRRCEEQLGPFGSEEGWAEESGELEYGSGYQYL